MEQWKFSVTVCALGPKKRFPHWKGLVQVGGEDGKEVKGEKD